ncbi:thioredoxin-disulfide reductase [Bifidobacterium magnum]|uniref:Thioredoxin reductase n=1 Tax=Bifidobacterium magnum TaxID=1692 RepID=A0A087B7X3_9BIFI|nr:thioredoxin-disulfide reductase [Bifidobacterium magnum]KFI67123.1 Thioredoxin-disulfide reductase [Bifidobacterium magnum]
MSELRQVIIVGSGPAGYTAAIYLGRAGFKPLVIAGALTAGGQLINTTEVENFPGFPDGILGPDLMENMQRQAERFGAEILYEDVMSADLNGPVKTVYCSGGLEFSARSVIVATGAAYRKLDVPGEIDYSGKGVSYCATCDGFFFRNKPVVVVGGGDSALEEAIFLTRFASSVTVVHRRGELRASKIMVERAMANDKIDFVLNSIVTSINGDGAAVTSVTLESTLPEGVSGEDHAEEIATLPAQGVFVAIGHEPATAFLGDSGLAMDDRGYITVDGASTRTSIEGVFAAGDCADHEYMQAVAAAGMGCRAALDAQAYMDNLAALNNLE